MPNFFKAINAANYSKIVKVLFHSLVSVYLFKQFFFNVFCFKIINKYYVSELNKKN